MPTYEVIAHKACATKFSVTAGTRKEAEDAIAEKLRSNVDLVWKDNSGGINVVCFWGDDVWRPRRRFNVNHDGDLL